VDVGADPDFIELCRRELELCKLVEGETTVVLSSGDQRAGYADAFLLAAEQLGAPAFHLRLPEPSAADGALARTRGSGAALARHPAALEALTRADLVIDLMFLLFSREQTRILESGARMLLCLEPVDVLARLFPTADLRERTEAAQSLLAAASTLRIANEQGTDVVYRLGAYPVLTEYGFTDEPGRWDHWPAGFVFTGGADDGVDGSVTLAPGDILFPFRQHVREAVTFRIESGRIVDLRGGVEADMLRDYMAGFHDPDAYAISHIGWGLNERARWWGALADPAVMGMESRSYYGSVLFSTGPNGQLGGSNDSACHLDIPMARCSVYLDDAEIIREGEILVEEMRCAQRPAAAP
jgi:2,5-dihydroxypyridine 5,6-dioxygenase